MRHRHPIVVAVPALLLAIVAWSGSTGPSCVPVEPDEPAECSEEECGPPPACPAYECPDGSLAGCTGRCLRDEDGVCGWEVRECPDPCADVPQCAFLCPPGTRNPVDALGCVHTCACVSDEECTPEACGSPPDCATYTCPDGSPGGCTDRCYRDGAGECVWERRECPEPQALRWYETCGDPVCGGWRDTGAPACAGQRAGDPCAVEGAECDPHNLCNSHLRCTTEDPRQQPGGCPISRRAFKQDVRYLAPADRDRLRDELLGFRLATYRYRAAPERTHLGFVIEDHEPSPAIDAARDRVDLYGYTSMVVAALQAQAEEIARLRQRIEQLETCQPGPAR